MEKASSKKVCFICSSGGHLEQIKQLKKIINKYNCFYVTNKTVSTMSMKEKKYLVWDLARTRFRIFNFFHFLIMCVQQLFIFVKERPHVIITTGAGIAIPMCLIGKLFNKKTIYIESFARMNSINKTGKFLYKYVDLFIVQWEQLLKFYPKAIYGGWIY